MAGTVKTAIVTGGGSGVGRAVALAFGRDGYKVPRSRGAGRSRWTRRSRCGPKLRSTAFPGRMSPARQTSTPCSQAKSQFGRLDVIFDDAGTGAPAAPVGDIAPAQWRAVIDVNLTGAFLCTRAAFDMMREQEPTRAATSSTTVPYRPTFRGSSFACPTRRRNTPSPGSRVPPRLTGGLSILLAGRSTSAMPPPP